MSPQVGFESRLCAALANTRLEASYAPVSFASKLFPENNSAPINVRVVTPSYFACMIYSASQFSSSSLIGNTRSENK